MSEITHLATAILWGTILAAGLFLMLASLPRWRAVSLADRIAPFVRDAVPYEVLPTLRVRGESLTRQRLLASIRSRFDRALGSTEILEKRLAQAGLAPDAAAFRGRQLLWTLYGLGAGSALLVVLVVSGRMQAPMVLVPFVGAAAGAVLCDMLLTSKAKARVARLGDELPTTLEFLALCLAAGEGMLDALRRVAAIGSGELAQELRHVVLDVNTGSTLTDALGSLSRRIDLPGLSRAVDQTIAALDRGAPLATVLHAQAEDAREDAKRALIEQSGRKELLMMLPLVFLILPLSVLFAIYPGMLMLQFGIN